MAFVMTVADTPMLVSMGKAKVISKVADAFSDSWSRYIDSELLQPSRPAYMNCKLHRLLSAVFQRRGTGMD